MQGRGSRLMEPPLLTGDKTDSKPCMSTLAVVQSVKLKGKGMFQVYKAYLWHRLKLHKNGEARQVVAGAGHVTGIARRHVTALL